MAGIQNIDVEIAAFEKWLEQFPLARNTKRIYAHAVRTMLGEIKELSEHEVNSFLSSHRRVFYKSGAFRYLKFKGLHKQMELVKVSDPPPKIQERPDHKEWMPILERIRGLGSPYQDLYWTGRILFYTYARINEVLSIKFKHVNLHDSVIVLWKIGRSIKKSDAMPIPKDVMTDLYTWLSREKGLLNDDRILYTGYAKPLYAYNQYRTEIDKLIARAILTEKEGMFMKRSHTFRRSGTDAIYAATGGDVIATADARRDEDVRTTIRYLETVKRKERADDAKRKFLAKMEEAS